LARELRTSESVSEGHPDKVADRLSDTVLDAALRDQRRARVAVEALVTRGRVILAGEVSGLSKPLDYVRLVREAVRDIGYLEGDFAADEVFVETLVHEQSPEIAAAVSGQGGDEGAGDQGIMFGYACKETADLMPAPIHHAHRILERLAALRKAGEARIRPDAKSQVTLEYVDGVPRRAHTVVVSHQHAPGFGGAALEELVRGVVREALPEGWVDADTRLLVNPSGSFVHGGPAADTGLTGRKIVVDTYGGAVPHGGGAFSGKDPSKVDRSAAYAARWLAKNVVASGLADRCLVQLAYAIGVAKPVALRVETFGTGLEDDWTIGRAIERCVDLTPRGIRDRLKLDFPKYAPTAAYGHFGRRPDLSFGLFTWERLDLLDPLLQNLA
jgi:S-adenosylmethionine synthetase